MPLRVGSRFPSMTAARPSEALGGILRGILTRIEAESRVRKCVNAMSKGEGQLREWEDSHNMLKIKVMQTWFARPKTILECPRHGSTAESLFCRVWECCGASGLIGAGEI